ncbi:MAG: MarC family protein [Chlamydiales bacterium]|nr:MarC family protein [Chlamydiales bacterium]
MSIFDLALQLFLITNPIGNSPAILTLVKNFSFTDQKRIMMRETFFALALALFFQFVGEPFLDALGIKDYALSMCGGVLILLAGLGMIFPHHENDAPKDEGMTREPYIVPIATPLLSGAGLLTYIMIYSKKLDNPLEMTAAILVCWVGVFAVMGAAPYLMRAFGKRGMYAMEQLMGLVLSMIAVEMIVKGAGLFIKGL